MVEKYHKLQMKPKTTEELKVTSHTIWEQLLHKRISEQDPC